MANKNRKPLPDEPENGLVEPYISLRCFYNIFTKVPSFGGIHIFFEVYGLKIKVPLKERCPLCRSFLTLRARAKHDKSIDVTEIAEAEVVHNEFWLNQRGLVRTMNDLVEDYIDDDSDSEGFYDSDDIVFTS